MTVVRDLFSVGGSATVRCSSDNLAARMDWLRNEIVVVSAFSTQHLDLVFSPVNDSIHNQVYVCMVTRSGGNGMAPTAVQNFTVNVDGRHCLDIHVFNNLLCSSFLSQSLQLPSLPLLAVQALPELG